MNKKSFCFWILLIIFFLFFPYIFYGQTTSVTGTVTDSDGITWTSAKWSVSFQTNGIQTNPCIYQLSGQSLCSNAWKSYLSKNGTSDPSTGVISVTLLDNSLISPSGTKWVWTVQSNTSAIATQYSPITISGSSVDLSSFLSSNSIAPRFPALGPQSYGYSDVEVSTIPNPGAYYYSVTNQATRQWSGPPTNVWQNLTTSSWNGGTVSNPITTPSISANCSKISIQGDTRCYTGANVGARISACLADATKKICDASSENSTLTISSTINIGENQHLILPSKAVSTSIAPAIIANGVNGWTINGSTTPGANLGTSAYSSSLVPSVHGPVIEVEGDSNWWNLSNFVLDYTVITGGTLIPSSNSDDKAIVVSGTPADQDKNLNLINILVFGAYDGFWDGNYTSANFTFGGTNSNVVVLDTFQGQDLGNSVITVGVGSGVHDQYLVINSGCNACGVKDGFGAMYFNATNNLEIDQGTFWHLNDPASNTNLAPLNFSGLRVESSLTCTLRQLDFEADHPIGASSLLHIVNSNCSLDGLSSFANVWGGNSALNYNQQYIRVDTNAVLTIHGSLNVNNNNSDTCSNTSGGTVFDSVMDSEATLKYLSGKFSDLHTMPSGTGCIPNSINTRTDVMDAPLNSPNNGEYDLNGALGATYLLPGSVFETETSGANPPVNGYVWAIAEVSTANPINKVNGQTIGVTGLPNGHNCTIYYRPTGAGLGPTATYDETAICAVGLSGVSDFEVWVSNSTTIGSESFSKILAADYNSIVTAKHYKSTGTPTIAADTGAGTSPTISITGNDEGGVINLTTGTTPVAASILTVTLNSSCPTTVYPSVTAENSTTAALNGTSAVSINPFSANQWTINSGSTALAANTAYAWTYIARCN